MIFYAQIPSPLGRILLTTDGMALTGLHFVAQKDCPVLPGLPPRQEHASDPTWGKIAGVAIKRFKAFEYENASGLLEFDPAPVTAPAPASVEPMQLMQSTPPKAQRLFELVQKELAAYFSQVLTCFTVPLAFTGTPFQQQVWNALLTVPYGRAVSYGDLARTAGLSSRHGRAVGAAVGRNPVSIIVPCHRVLSSTNTLTGYSGGLERKVALLQLEGFALQ